ncbi:Gamma-glutamyl hydrolase A [Chlorella vulgaris]
MRPAVALCVLSALVAASGVPLAAASRDLPQPTLFSGGKPWEKKPASHDKPLIGILAQPFKSVKCPCMSHEAQAKVEKPSARIRQLSAARRVAAGRGAASPLSVHTMWPSKQRHMQSSAAMEGGSMGRHSKPASAMRPAVALCVLSALVAASGVPLAAASRDLPQPTLFSGGKPWEKKPASHDKPLIGILAQPFKSVKCPCMSHEAQAKVEKPSARIRQLSAARRVAAGRGAASPLSVHTMWPSKQRHMQSSAAMEGGSMGRHSKPASAMRPAVALCVLSALVAASGVPLAAASRDLPQPTLFSGGKPWEKKPASHDKPLIGILAQPFKSVKCPCMSHEAQAKVEKPSARIRQLSAARRVAAGRGAASPLSVHTMWPSKQRHMQSSAAMEGGSMGRHSKPASAMRPAVALCVLSALVAASGVPLAAASRDLPQPTLFSGGKPWEKKPASYDKPLIGILAQACHYCPGRSYVAAGFVKWIEAAGGRAVPIRFYSSEEELHRVFKSVNGLIFPGGLTDLWMDSPYVVAARKLWQWSKDANDNGDVFPIHGTCLGFQLLHILEANVSFTDLLVDTDSVAHPYTLDFTDAAASSTMFGGLSEDLIDKLGDDKYNISMENHMFGLPPDHYDKWPRLREQFNLVSTSKDRNGVEYVSSAEHKHYPFFATQWHPEKPPFEFGMHEIPHTLDAILVSQHLANNFVDTARRSSHRPESPEQELELMIYNWKPYFTLKDSVMDPSYDGPDIYFFDRPDDEVPENALHTRQAAVKSFAGHLPAGRQSRGQSSMQGHLEISTDINNRGVTCGSEAVHRQNKIKGNSAAFAHHRGLDGMQGPMTRSRAATRRAGGDAAASHGGGTHFAVSTTLAVLTTPSPAQSNIVDHLQTEDKLNLGATCTSLQQASLAWFPDVVEVTVKPGTDVAALSSWLERHQAAAAVKLIWPIVRYSSQIDVAEVSASVQALPTTLVTSLTATQGLPDVAANLTALTRLDVAWSNLTAPPFDMQLQRLGQLVQLRTLRASWCDIHCLHHAAAAIPRLTRLTSLCIQGNNRVVADKAPSWTNLHALTALQVLSLERCSLTRVPPAVQTLALLASLDLSANENLNIHAAFAPQRVQRLLLNQCAFTAVPQHVSLLTDLTSLDLSLNGQLTKGWEHLKPLARLCSLDLGFCGLTSVPEAISALSALTLLDLSGNVELAGGWQHLSPLPQLRKLRLCGCDMESLSALSALTQLRLDDNCGVRGWRHLRPLLQLRVLRLRGCDLTKLPSALPALTALTYLDLSRGEDAAISKRLCQLTQLRHLVLGSCDLIRVPRQLSALTGLTCLDLSHNEELAGGWRHLRPLTRLCRLDVFCVPLPGGQTPSALTGLQHMQLRWKPPTGQSDFIRSLFIVRGVQPADQPASRLVAALQTPLQTRDTAPSASEAPPLESGQAVRVARLAMARAGRGLHLPLSGERQARLVLLCALLLAAASPLAAEPLWQHYESVYPSSQLQPVLARMLGHAVAYQLPAHPIATLFIAPGCSHAAHDWWPPSAACPECLGLPEEVAHMQQALARGYAVIVMSSKNAHGDMCMDWPTNHRDAVSIIDKFRRAHGLEGLPLYGLGVSVGGGFVIKLAAKIRMDGVVSEVLAPQLKGWNINKYPHGIPPTVFISMDQDPLMAARISAASQLLAQRNASTVTVCVAPRVVYPTYFSDRSSRITAETSGDVVAALHKIDMLDEHGMVTVDPRHTKRPWVRQLVALVPALSDGMTEDHSQVWEELNLAWSLHEIIADFATAAFVWLEGGATGDFAAIVEQYGAPGHTGRVCDAASAISQPTAAGEATASATASHQPMAEQQVYAVSEAAVRASKAEASAQEGTAAAQSPLQAGVQQQEVEQAAAAIQQLSDAGQSQQAFAVRELAPASQQTSAPAPAVAQSLKAFQGQDGIVAAATLQSGQPSEQDGIKAAAVAMRSADAGTEADAAAPGGAPASATSSSTTTIGGENLTPAVVTGAIGGAAVGVVLFALLYRLVKKPAGFQALPGTDASASHPSKQPVELPVSTLARLPSIPELPDSPRTRSLLLLLVPKEPRGAVFLAHGCVHSGYNYWPESDACPDCRGLPEELSHTLQALKLGYAVIAISSLDRETGCWSFWDDCFDVWDIISDWRSEWGLDHLPLYGAGISSGGSFVMKLPRYMKFDGVLSEALGIDPASGGIRDVPGVYPPTIIISMVKDAKQAEVIQENRVELEARNTPVQIIKAYPRQVYPTYFSERFPLYISDALSIIIHDALIEIGMIDEEGNVLEDPRYTDRPWLKELQDMVPQLQGDTEEFKGRLVPKFPDMEEDTRLPGVYSLMNLAWCLHEIISDYFSVALLWFESKPAEIMPEPATEAALTGVAASTPDVHTDGSATATPTSVESSDNGNSGSGGSSSNMAAIVGGAVGGAVGALLLVALGWWCVRRRQAARDAQGTSTMHAMHMPAAGVTANISLASLSLKDRFELTEVVEQTGSPSSARRRMRTTFTASPRKSPPRPRPGPLILTCLSKEDWSTALHAKAMQDKRQLSALTASGSSSFSAGQGSSQLEPKPLPVPLPDLGGAALADAAPTERAGWGREVCGATAETVSLAGSEASTEVAAAAAAPPVLTSGWAVEQAEPEAIFESFAEVICDAWQQGEEQRKPAFTDQQPVEEQRSAGAAQYQARAVEQQPDSQQHEEAAQEQQSLQLDNAQTQLTATRAAATAPADAVCGLAAAELAPAKLVTEGIAMLGEEQAASSGMDDKLVQAAEGSAHQAAVAPGAAQADSTKAAAAVVHSVSVAAIELLPTASDLPSGEGRASAAAEAQAGAFDDAGTAGAAPGTSLVAALPPWTALGASSRGAELEMLAVAAPGDAWERRPTSVAEPAAEGGDDVGMPSAADVVHRSESAPASAGCISPRVSTEYGEVEGPSPLGKPKGPLSPRAQAIRESLGHFMEEGPRVQ